MRAKDLPTEDFIMKKKILALVMSLVLGAVNIFLAVLLSYLLMKRHRSSKGFANDAHGYAIYAAIGYLAVSVAWHITDNVILFIENGFSSSIGDIMYILLPYVETGIFAACGYFLTVYFIKYFEE